MVPGGQDESFASSPASDGVEPSPDPVVEGVDSEVACDGAGADEPLRKGMPVVKARVEYGEGWVR